MRPLLPLLAALALAPAFAPAAAKVIPLPASMKELRTPPLVIAPDSVVVASGGADASAEAEKFACGLRAATGYALPLKASGEGAVTFTIDADLRATLGDEGYRLETGPAGARITAAASAGLFYGAQTLRNLLPPQAFSSTPARGVKWTVPAVSIEDKPRFAWRGFMLDESRQFFGAAYVKHLLDNMAAHKLNRFHWHLTDDEGWRIEIKSLPELTGIGAWRGTECALPDVREEGHKRIGGFYTQEQIREIIAYAKARHIEIMPEIDLPGHALALVTAYPEALPTKVGGGVSAQGFRANAISPARPESLAIVDKIYEEVSALFPFEYIHIGGDEVNHAIWSECPQIRAQMAANGLKNLHDAQVLFTKRLEGVLSRRGKKLFGWNEVLDERLDKGTGIMSWTGTGPGYQAARRGFPVVMAPGPHAYFDMGYGGASGEPKTHGWAGDVTNARVYAFDPLGDGGALKPEEQARILGVHGALWTEFVRPWKGDFVEFKTYGAAADYRIWPRLIALAEVGWTPREKRSYDDFLTRLDADHYRRLAATGTYFRVPVPEAVTLKAGKITVKGPYPGADLHYTFDGTAPTAKSPRYEAPIPLDGRDPGRFRLRNFIDARGSTLVIGAKAEPIGFWKERELKAAPADFTYDATGNLASGGVWRIVFRREGGDKPLRLDRAVVTVNGEPVAEAGAADIVNRGDRAVARVSLTSVPAGAKVAVVATLAAPEGDRVRGAISLVKSERLEPAVKVASPLGAYGDNTADKAGDWDDDTFFWINHAPRPGVLATWEFERPVPVRKVSVRSGERNGTRDQLVGGDLEISEDGKTFRKAASFAYGSAEAELPAGTRIRAMRVVATEAQTTWVMLGDPVLR